VKKSATDSGPARYGRGTGVPNPVDVHVGARVRTRRLLIGMNQETLARALGLTFQQVQKYEGGANRVSASRLSQIAEILGVSISYFFNDLEPDGAEPSRRDVESRERLQRPETIELIRSYYAIANSETRHQFLEMVKAVALSHQRQQ
jgi:transcriptional regulator with XRE-family HTH domain